MTTMKTNNLVQALLAVAFLGVSGCGDSDTSNSSNSAVSLEVTAAYGVMLQAHAEKQLSMYRIVKALSNDYQAGLLAVDPTDTQLQVIEDEMLRLEAMAPEVLAAWETLTESSSLTSTLYGASLWEPNPVLEQVPLVNVFYRMATFTDRERNSFFHIANKLSYSELVSLYDAMPDTVKTKATTPYEFYTQMETGELDDYTCIIVTTARDEVNFGTLAQQYGQTRLERTYVESLELLKAGVETMNAVYGSGGSAGAMANKMVKAATLAALVEEGTEYQSNKSTVMYENADTSTPVGMLDSTMRVAGAVALKMTDVINVVEETPFEDAVVVTGNDAAFEVNTEGVLTEEDVDEGALATSAQTTMNTVSNTVANVDPSDVTAPPAGYGIVVIGTDGSTEVEGFVALHNSMTTAAAPSWMLGYGVSASDNNVIWMGIVPEGEWEFVLLDENGNESQAVTATVSAGTPAILNMVPPESGDTDTTDTDNSNSGSNSWFDNISYSTDGGDDDLFQYDNSSCDERSIPDGTCTDYIGMNSESANNMDQGCQGTFFYDWNCDPAGISFSCYMDVATPGGDEYEMRVRIYDADSVPADIRQNTCDMTCLAAGMTVEVSNCRLVQ